MDMTLEQYILNPMGKNNAVLNAMTRENIRKGYIVKFDNLLLRESGKIEYYLYKDSKSNTYWAHIKVPSEVVRDFYYDVVFKFSANQSIEGAGENLFKYNVKFYSNDPAFVFTYAHVFVKNDLFVKELMSKMSSEAIRKAAVEKNPTEDVGYVKAIYFAYLLMQNRKLNKKSKFELESKPLDIKSLVGSIENADIKIQQRQEEGAKVSKKKKITLDKNTAKNFTKNLSQDADASRLQITTTKSVGKIQRKTDTKPIVGKSIKAKTVKSVAKTKRK